MALSEHEQEMLDQIERGLRTPGPKVATRWPAAGTGSTRSHRRILIVIAAIAVGLVLVFAGLISKAIVISVLGFIVIVAAATLGGGNLARLWAHARRAVIGRANILSELSQPVRKPDRTSDES